MVNLTKNIDGKLQCLLCPHYCKIAPGKTGICGVRKNTGEKIELFTWGIVSGYALDPVEKKPLYHFYPGYNILSIGSYGCNMRCDFCQNYRISQNVPSIRGAEIRPEKIIGEALTAERNIGIAFTYNEPGVAIEYMRDVALPAREKGLKTVMVTNGYVNEEPLGEIIQFIDAFNIDLKAFNDNFYRKLAGARLEPVKKSLKQVALSGRHLEVTTLIIPGQNDDPKEMELETEWIANELGKDVPLHLSRFYPMFKREDLPTSEESLRHLYEIASGRLNHVYLGNLAAKSGQNTKCTACGAIVTERSGYSLHLKNLDDKGRCSICGNMVYRYFTPSSSKES
jgi:pyruvate formate lyase activating enzyme